MSTDTRTNEQIARERAELERDPPPRERRLAVVADAVAPMQESSAFRWALGMASAARSRVQRDDCPRCTPSCEVATACKWTEEDICRHREGIAALRAEEEITRMRRSRLERAGVKHAVVLGTFPALRRPPDPARLVAPEQAEAARAGMAAAAKYLRERKPLNLVLTGAAGTGKTWAAAWVVAGSPHALWLPFTSIAPVSSWEATRARALSDELLVVNDLGSGPLVGWRDAEVEALIVERDDATLPTVVTTNLPPAQLRQRFGDRLHRRLVGAGGRIVECVGPDLSARSAS